MCQARSHSHAALGFTMHLMGDVDGAIDSYHHALSLQPEDAFCNEMLNVALQDDFNKPDSTPPPTLTVGKMQTKDGIKSRASLGTTRRSSLASGSSMNSIIHMDQSSNFTFDNSASDISMT
mmetsp:Transcript_11346/g.14819  ORF Transcript_11346/g.14819 Transcript_11346/m.14819 type:complete len:121 (-) Transcript_11346:276-638(-)